MERIRGISESIKQIPSKVREYLGQQKELSRQARKDMRVKRLAMNPDFPHGTDCEMVSGISVANTYDFVLVGSFEAYGKCDDCSIEARITY